MRAGGTGEEICNDVVTSSGMFTTSKYVIGNFSGTATFGSITLTSSGNTDIYVAKLDDNNNWVWALRAGGTGADHGLHIASDGLGNLCITGDFRGTANFGSYVVSSYTSTYSDIFVAKLDLNGNWLWANKAGGSWDDFGRSISCDNAGNAYITGSYLMESYFGIITLARRDLGDDIFVAKISSSGVWQWARGAGAGWDTYNYDYGYGIHTDYSTGTCFVTGSFAGTALFGTYSVSSYGGQDIFVAKIDNSGNWQWAQKAGGTGFDRGQGIYTDLNGVSYVTGSFTGYTTFASNQHLTSAGSNDVFVAKLDASGNWTWAIRGGGTGLDAAYSCVLGDNLYLTGTFSATAGFGSTTLVSGGGYDTFASAVDTNGNWLWSARAGRSGTDTGRGIAYSRYSTIYKKIIVAGDFSDTVRFGGTLLTSAGNTDVFVAEPVSNLAAITPLSPQNISISATSLLVGLSWNYVTQDTNGNHCDPDYYQVYFCSTPNGTYNSINPQTTSNWWTQGLSNPRGYYKVRAVVLDY
jgi:hypothetical protein